MLPALSLQVLLRLHGPLGMVWGARQTHEAAPAAVLLQNRLTPSPGVKTPDSLVSV